MRPDAKKSEKDASLSDIKVGACVLEKDLPLNERERQSGFADPQEGHENESGLRKEKELLLSKLKDIPIEKLRELITSQIDLEIRLKHKELKLTEEEIGKCESQMLTLRNFFEVPSHVNLPNEPEDFTMKYYNLLNKALSVSYSTISNDVTRNQPEPLEDNASRYTYRTRSTTSSLRPSKLTYKQPTLSGCVYRRTDNILVKLTCPDCHRSNFSSAQGFLNHSRIAHSKEYTSQDGAALQCGVILSNEEQDEDGLNSLQSLRDKNLDPNKNLNVDEIYFNGLSNSLNTVHCGSIDKSVSPLENEGKETVGQKKTPSHLMKKLVLSGLMHNEEDYDKLLEDTTKEVEHPHLFEDEEEEEKDEPPEDDSKKVKRRKTRTPSSGSSPANTSLHQTIASTVSSHPSPPSSSQPPLPKIKLRLRNTSKLEMKADSKQASK